MTLALLLIGCQAPSSTDDTPETPPRVPCEGEPAPGELCTIAGTGTQGLQNNEFTAAEIWLNQPSAVSFDPIGRVILTDFNNMRVLRLLETGEFEVLVGTGFHAYAGPDGILGVSSGPHGFLARPEMLKLALVALFAVSSGSWRPRHPPFPPDRTRSHPRPSRWPVPGPDPFVL